MSFKKEVDICICHGEKRLIVNRTHWLCKEGNDERLSRNKDPEEKKKKFNSLLKRTAIKASSKKVNSVSKKRLETNREYSRICKEIARERLYICTGCGSTDGLTHSHLIPRSKRPDLVANKKNIKYHCTSIGNREGCHQQWESHCKRMQLDDFEENMQIVKELDYNYYCHLIVKMKECKECEKKS